MPRARLVSDSRRGQNPHEKLRPPRAIRLALPGPLRPLARVRGDGGDPLVHQPFERVPAPEDPLLQPELQDLVQRADRAIRHLDRDQTGPAGGHGPGRATRRPGGARPEEDPRAWQRRQGPAVAGRAEAGGADRRIRGRRREAPGEGRPRRQPEAGPFATRQGSCRRPRRGTLSRQGRADRLERYGHVSPPPGRHHARPRGRPDVARPLSMAEAAGRAVRSRGPLPHAPAADRLRDGGRGGQGPVPVPARSPRRRHHPAQPVRHPQPVLPPHHGAGPRQLLRPGVGRARCRGSPATWIRSRRGSTRS